MNLEDLKKIRERRESDMLLREGKARIRVVVSMGTSGIAAGARQTMHALMEEIGKRGLKDVIITQSGEWGLASKEPVVSVHEGGKPTVVYGGVNIDAARKIVDEHIVNGNPVASHIVDTQK